MKNSMRNKLFLDLNGVPYVIGEYFNNQNLSTIDRTLITNGISIDNTEAYRAVVRINIDDIGRRASDNLPATMGNRTKQKALLTMIHNNAPRLNQVLDTVRPGLIVRVNYRIEDLKTTHIIRAASEDLRIPNKSYFVDINDDLNDNALIVNFTDSIVSTLTHFTHGTDRMLIRITSVELFYQVMRRKSPSANASSNWNIAYEYSMQDPRFNPYYHHQFYQPRQDIYGNRIETFLPSSWWAFNHFYHFDNMGSDLILHKQEIEDNHNESYLVAAGTVTVNRAFEINPGHRIVFHISVWKNDLTVVTDTTKIAKALNTSMLDCPKPNLDKGKLIKLLKKLTENSCGCNNEKLEKLIKYLIQAIVAHDFVVPNIPEDISPLDPTDPVNPTNPNTPNPIPGIVIDSLTEEDILSIFNILNEPNTPGVTTEDSASLTDEEIDDLVEELIP